jgi:hypothetical protein
MRHAAATILATILSTAVLAAPATAQDRPTMPDWQTDAACEWVWTEGGGLGLWAERCPLSGLWEVVWSEEAGAFVQLFDGAAFGRVVKPFPFSEDTGWEGLREILVAAGDLAADAPCAFEGAAIRPAPRTVGFVLLTPTAPDALAPTETGDVPDPVCGPYGVSTHGVRYFLTDLRIPGVAIFVEEGQERPMFDPTSLTAVPPA